ncbi:hypothetical protein TYRP_021748 [Tyrophagus putrescentiae]|nr:hypothetical protein TYRP_021748 [Tyrophagus putrescentiae]
MPVLVIGDDEFADDEADKTAEGNDDEVNRKACDPGWEPFAEEKCLKVLEGVTRSFAEAVEASPFSPNSISEGGGLLRISTYLEQRFIVNLLFRVHRVVDSVWLATRAKDRAQPTVPDQYGNWASRVGLADLGNEPNDCVQMTAEEPVRGKWIEVPCAKRNLVVCQRAQNWSPARLHQAIVKLRRELEKVGSKKNVREEEEVQEKKTEVREEVQQVLPPIGFTYLQLPGDLSPESLWPSAAWTEVSDTYSGLFFRPDWSPRLSKLVRTVHRTKQLKVVSPLELKPGRLSPPMPLQFEPKDEATVQGGDNGEPSGFKHSELAFLVAGGEVRPRNVAIKVWRRTG